MELQNGVQPLTVLNSSQPLLVRDDSKAHQPLKIGDVCQIVAIANGYSGIKSLRRQKYVKLKVEVLHDDITYTKVDFSTKLDEVIIDIPQQGLICRVLNSDYDYLIGKTVKII